MEINSETAEHYLEGLKKKYQYLQEVVDFDDMPMFAFTCLIMCEILIALLSDYVSLEDLAEKDKTLERIITNLGQFEHNFSNGIKEQIKMTHIF
jgi:hypothetical protein